MPMKTIHKRLYQTFPVIPRSVNSSTANGGCRVRSNSASSSRSLYTGNGPLFFDSPPPPPSSRPAGHHIGSHSRLPLEVKTEVELHLNSQYNSGTNQPSNLTPYSQPQPSGPHPPFSLALTSSPSNSSAPYHPGSHYPPIFHYSPFKSVSSSDTHTLGDIEALSQSKRHRSRYHLDVGAYGIPKRSKAGGYQTSKGMLRPVSTQPLDSSPLAVQVGEDAYFIRENAMGVADGVGGWSKARHGDFPLASVASSDPSPSALFARRLMHFCAKEVDASLSTISTGPFCPLAVKSDHTLQDTSSFRATQTSSFASTSLALPLNNPTSPISSPSDPYDLHDLHEELEDSLEELEEGIDVLVMLERAYENALKAHVVSAASASQTELAAVACPEPTDSPEPEWVTDRMDEVGNSSGCQSPSAPESAEPITPSNYTPAASKFSFLSSAIRQSQDSLSSGTIPLLAGSSTALVAVLDHSSCKSGTSNWEEPSISAPESPDTRTGVHGPVIKIAHLGDCMGMLIRGEEIVWRSQEMWSSFNTPLQLGPSSSTRPQDARIFAIPVQTDDILILASDGLSDNLWDEEVLDEVIRFRRSFLSNNTALAFTRTSSYAAPGLLGRRTLAGMLSEALCSRARHVSERPAKSIYNSNTQNVGDVGEPAYDDTPFARKAKEQGKCFSGGKSDDISVLVALISPATVHVPLY